jgi:hypothetical protein
MVKIITEGKDNLSILRCQCLSCGCIYDITLDEIDEKYEMPCPYCRRVDSPEVLIDSKPGFAQRIMNKNI